MRSGVVDVFDPTGDIFDLNPHLVFDKRLRDFKDFCKEKGWNYNDILWSIAYIYDYDSIYFNLEFNERMYLVCNDYLKDEKFIVDNIVELEPIINFYNKLQEDSEKRFLSEWNNKMDEISLVLKKWEASREDMKDIIDVMLKIEKLMDQKDKIMDRIAKRSNSKIVGGGSLSMLEESVED